MMQAGTDSTRACGRDERCSRTLSDDCTLQEGSSRALCEAKSHLSELVMSSVMVYLEKDVFPNAHQAAPRVYNRTAARPSSPDFQPVTNKDCRTNNRRTAFRRVSSTKSTQHLTTRTLKASNHGGERGVPSPWDLGRLPTQF